MTRMVNGVQSIFKSSGFELVTEHPIEQTLSLVTHGDPTPAMKAVIDAARRAAEKVM